MAARRNFNYNRLAVDEDDYDDDENNTQNDPRFNYTPKTFDKIPWKSIILAIFLLLLGFLLLLLSSFIFTGPMEGESSQAYGLSVLGLLPSSQDSMRLELRTIHGDVPKANGFRHFLILTLLRLHPIPASSLASPSVPCQDLISCKNFLSLS